MDLARIDLNLLLTLEALVELRSVTRAAARLGIRQPATSAALAKLRVLFGDELLVRAGSEMQPTPRAVELARDVGAALALLRASIAMPTPFDPAASHRTFVIASSDYTSLVIAPRLVRALVASAPAIDLRLIGYEKEEISELLRERVVDVAVGVFPAVKHATAVRTSLFEERFVGVVRAGHPFLATAARARLAAFVALPHVLVSLRRDARGAVDDALAARGLARRVALTIPHMLALPSILQSTQLVAAVPSRVARRFADEGLVVFDLPLDVPPWRVDMLFPATARKDPGSIWLRAAVRRAARAEPDHQRHR